MTTYSTKYKKTINLIDFFKDFFSCLLYFVYFCIPIFIGQRQTTEDGKYETFDGT